MCVKPLVESTKFKISCLQVTLNRLPNFTIPAILPQVPHRMLTHSQPAFTFCVVVTIQIFLRAWHLLLPESAFLRTHHQKAAAAHMQPSVAPLFYSNFQTIFRFWRGIRLFTRPFSTYVFNARLYSFLIRYCFFFFSDCWFGQTRFNAGGYSVLWLSLARIWPVLTIPF